MDRIYQNLIRDHMANDKQMVFLAGPRQVGKTTVSLHLNSSLPCHYLNWDKPLDRQLIVAGPTKIGEHFSFLGLHKQRPVIIFDEIHKYGQWKNFLKGFYDTYHSTLHILVTGSAKLDIYQKGGDSLMGRYFLYRMHPISVAECCRITFTDQPLSQPTPITDEQFTRLFNFGGFPEPFLKGKPFFMKRWLKARNKLLFQEDIRSLTQIQEIAQLEMLSEFIKTQSGQLLNLSHLAKMVNVSISTIKRWISTLEQFYYCFLLRPWSKNIARSLTKDPKIYLWNWAEIQDVGSKAESFVASHLLKAIHFWNDRGIGDYELYFVRDKDKREVDFLVVRENQPWFLVEVKQSNNRRISPHLYRFHEQLKTQHAFQVVIDLPYVDVDCFTRHDPVIVPAKTFLSQLV